MMERKGKNEGGGREKERIMLAFGADLTVTKQLLRQILYEQKLGTRALIAGNFSVRVFRGNNGNSTTT